MAPAKFQPVEHVRAYERIVHQIEQALFRGDLRPGDRLPSERELMAQFEVSRATVREALRVLQSASIIRSRPGDPTGGAEVQDFSTSNLEKSLAMAMKLERLDVKELVGFRMVTEGAATHLAAVLHTDEQLAKMKAALERMRESLGEDFEAFSAADVDFHHAVAESAGNKLLRITNEVVRDIVAELIRERLIRSDDRLEQMHETLARHARVLDAIEQRDGVRAAELARRDLLEYYGGFVEDEARQSLAAQVSMETGS